jgi:hypothetical protein
MLRNLSIAVVCIAFAAGFAGAKFAQLEGEGASPSEKRAVVGAGCSTQSAVTKMYCYNMQGGGNSDCTGCGCKLVFYPVGFGPRKTNTEMCDESPSCTILQLKDESCAGGY